MRDFTTAAVGVISLETVIFFVTFFSRAVELTLVDPSQVVEVITVSEPRHRLLLDLTVALAVTRLVGEVPRRDTLRVVVVFAASRDLNQVTLLKFHLIASSLLGLLSR